MICFRFLYAMIVALPLFTAWGCDSSFRVGSLDLSATDLDLSTPGEMSTPGDLTASGDSGTACQSPSDCRLCPTNLCQCMAAAVSLPDSVCYANNSCFVDPCLNKHAVCVANQCVVQ